MVAEPLSMIGCHHLSVDTDTNCTCPLPQDRRGEARAGAAHNTEAMPMASLAPRPRDHRSDSTVSSTSESGQRRTGSKRTKKEPSVGRRVAARMPRSVDTLKARLLDSDMAPWEGPGLECRVTRILNDGVVTTQVRLLGFLLFGSLGMH